MSFWSVFNPSNGREKNRKQLFYGQRFFIGIAGIVICALFSLSSSAAELKPERLPKDTLAFIEIPSIEQALAAFEQTPWGKMTHSEAFAPFWLDSLSKLHRRAFQPLCQELLIEPLAWSNIFKGHLLLALIPSKQNNIPLNDTPILILSALKGSGEKRLETAFSQLRDAWTTEGRELPSQAVGKENTLFYRFQISRTSLEQMLEALRLAPTEGILIKNLSSQNIILWAGLYEHQLILCLNDLSAAEKLIHSSEANQGILRDLPAFAEQKQLLRSEAITRIWIQPPPIINMIRQTLSISMQRLEKETADANKKLNPFMPNPVLLLNALKLESISSASLITELVPDGLRVRFQLTSPAAQRQGITRLLNACQSGDCSTPDFAPSEAISFSRLKINIPTAIRELDKIANEAWPLKDLLFLGFNEGFRREIPQVNITQELIDRLGNEWLSFELPSLDTSDNLAPITLCSASEPPKILTAAQELYEKLEPAIGFKQPLKLDILTEPELKDSSLYRLSSSDNKFSFYLAANTDYIAYSPIDPSTFGFNSFRTPSSDKKNIKTPLTFFREEKSREKARLLWGKLVKSEEGSDSSQELQSLLPFPLNRLRYDKLPPFESCEQYFCPASFTTLNVTPQGLEGTVLKIFPEKEK